MNNTNQTDATVLTTVQQAIAAAQAGNKPLARLHLENAIASEHDNPNYWLWIAWTAESPTSAISALKHALDLAPDHSLARQGLTWALAMQDFDLSDYGQSAPAGETVASTAETEAPSETDSQTSVEAADDDDASLEAVESDTLDIDLGLQLDDIPTIDAENTIDLVAVDDEAAPDEDELPLETVVEEPVVEIDEEREPVEAELCVDAEPEVEVEAKAEEAEVVEAEATDKSPVEAEIVDVTNVTEELTVEDSRESDDADETETPSSDGRLTVMAVDDSPTIRKIVSMSLESVGYNVVTAADGMEALQQLPKCNPALILTDISMPKIDGYQLCKLIKSHAKTKTIPVIMLSGKDGMFDKIKGKFVGCDDYITKPFQSADLLDKVSSYLPAPVSDS